MNGFILKVLLAFTFVFSVGAKSITLNKCSVQYPQYSTVTGIDSEVLCGVIAVPLDYQEEAGELIELDFVITANSMTELKFSKPIYIDYGGPISGHPKNLIHEYLKSKRLKKKKDRVFINLAQRHSKDDTLSEQKRFHYNTKYVALDIFKLMDKLGYDNFNYYGSSYGGHIAMHLLSIDENKISKVILDSSSNVVSKDKQNDEMAGPVHFITGLDEIFCLAYHDCSYSNYFSFNHFLSKLKPLYEYTSSEGRKIRVTPQLIVQTFSSTTINFRNTTWLFKMFSLMKREPLTEETIEHILIEYFLKPLGINIEKSSVKIKLQQTGPNTNPAPQFTNSYLHKNFVCEFTLSGHSYKYAPHHCLKNEERFYPLSISKKTFTTPALILSGNLDTITPRESVKELSTLFADVVYKNFLFAGHGVRLDTNKLSCTQLDLFDYFDGAESRERLVNYLNFCENNIIEFLKSEFH